jgi:hypothetical protein
MASRAYRGASLEAMVRLGRRRGYRLVACERVNAFFVRNDVAGKVVEIDAQTAFQAHDKGAGNVFDKIATKVRLPLVPVDAEGRPGAPVPATSFLR